VTGRLADLVGSSPVIAALSTSHKLGLIVVAAIFITFALVSSFVLPKREPDFPGNRMKLFVGICIVLFISMLSAVVIFGSEPEEPGARVAQRTTTTDEPTATGQVTATTKAPTAVAGDAANGKALYASKTCSGCHSIDGSFIAGPTFKGLAGSKQTLADGTSVTADRAYLVESIVDPGKQVVKCANCGPPSSMLVAIKPHQISVSDANDLAAYIESLK
jgi:mono/diheme cytochrome c family protein